MIPLASTFLDRVRAGAAGTRDMSRMSAWIVDHTRHPKDKLTPWSFANHEMQIDIANDQHHHTKVRKCSQVGLSELSVRLSLGMLSIFSGSTAIYTLPTAKFASKFAKSRINPVVEASRTLSDLVPPGADSAELKQFGSSFLYVVGTSGQSSPISIPADMLVRDEVDFSNQALLSMFFSRLGHAEEGGWIRDFSTPTVDKYGISADFDSTTKGRYVVKCYHCSDRVALDPFRDVIIPGYDGKLVEFEKEDLDNPGYDIANAALLCPTCRNEVTQANLMDASTREWVHANPDAEMGGYQVMPFDVPFVNPLAKTIKAIDQYERKADWVNFEWGKPYQDADNSFLASVIKANTVVQFIPAGPFAAQGCVAGLDIGKTSWIVIGKRLSGGKAVDIIYAEQIRQDDDDHLFKRTMELMKWFGVVRLVVDAGPDFSTVLKLIGKSLVDQVYGCYYVRTGKKNLSAIDVKMEEQVVVVGKVDSFNITSKAVNTGLVRFPRCQEMATIQSHCENMRRVSSKDSQGEMKTAWVNVGPDHYANALNYLMIALGLCEYLNLHAPAPAPATVIKARFGAEQEEDPSHTSIIPR